jgi:hypothetical protein
MWRKENEKLVMSKKKAPKAKKCRAKSSTDKNEDLSETQIKAPIELTKAQTENDVKLRKAKPIACNIDCAWGIIAG